MISVAVVEDNKNIREGLKILIDSTENYNCPAVFADCESLIKSLKKITPDVLLMDIGLPGINGIEGIKQVKHAFPDLAVLVLTVYEENELVFDALCAGACGYIVKKNPPKKLLEAIKDAYEGGAPMSSNIARKIIGFFHQRRPQAKDILNENEKKVLRFLAEGYSAKAISDSTSITVENVKYNFRSIYEKLHRLAKKDIAAGQVNMK